MRPIPMEIVVAYAEPGFVGQIRAEQVDLARTEFHGVFVQDGIEARVRRPDEIGFCEAVDQRASHQPVALARRTVIQALDGFLAIDLHGRFERDRGHWQIAASGGRRRKFGEELARQRSGRGVIRYENSGRNHDGVLEPAGCRCER